MSKSKLFLLALLPGVALLSIGLLVYSGGPQPYSIALESEDSSNVALKPGEWAIDILPSPISSVHAMFALNMSVLVTFGESNESNLTVFLLNEPQLLNWNSSNPHYALRRTPPNLNFSVEVEPGKYFLAFDGTRIEANMSVATVEHVLVVARNFDYGGIWPGLAMVLVGLVTLNVDTFFMKRAGMFDGLNTFFEKLWRPWISPPRGSPKAYSDHFHNAYQDFSKPLFSFCLQYLPILLVIFIVFRIAPRTSSPFTGVAWDYVALTAITWYFLLLAFLAVFFFLMALIVPREQDFGFLISKKAGLLKRSLVDYTSKIGSLNLSVLRNRRMIAVIGVPLSVFAATSVIFRETLFNYEAILSSPDILVIIGILIAYYGLVFSYIDSKSSYQILGRMRRSRIELYRKHKLIEGLVSIAVTFAFFSAMFCIFIIICFYIWMPIASSSLAAKCGLTSIPSVSATSVIFLVAKVLASSLLLYYSMFLGITGYVVPTLLDKGVKGSLVASVALVLTFITERALSAIIMPQVESYWVLSLVFSFSVFILVLVFEKFYTRMLRKI